MRNIVITGATGGIGSATAHILDQQGCILLLVGRSEDKLDNLISSLSGNRHTKVIADLTTQEGIDRLQTAAEEFGVDGLINCLGINALATLSSTQENAIFELVATNLVAPIRVCQVLLPLLEARSKAVIVNIGSILGSIGYAGSSIYCASKFGLRGFTESLRRELGDTNVSVIYLAPRATNTALNTDAMNQMNRELGNSIDEPEKVAEQISHVLKCGKAVNRYLGWPERFFVKLNSLIPVLVDKALHKNLSTVKRYCGMNQAKQLDVQTKGSI